MSRELAEKLIATLPIGQTDAGLFNPWREHCEFDAPGNTLEAKIDRLARHLACNARQILVGEAPGYQGCRYSGIAFTNERQLMKGLIPRISPVNHRLTTRRLPFSEPSATIVWNTLHALGLAETTINWNTVQLHPFKPGSPWSNRTPNKRELAHGVAALRILQAHFPKARIIAVGNNAEDTLIAHGIPFATKIRHPANGGATEFAEGLAKAVKK